MNGAQTSVYGTSDSFGRNRCSSFLIRAVETIVRKPLTNLLYTDFRSTARCGEGITSDLREISRGFAPKFNAMSSKKIRSGPIVDFPIVIASTSVEGDFFTINRPPKPTVLSFDANFLKASYHHNS
jgi:hypothetical protein